MKFVLPTLPYGYDALEPFIDARTMELHYTKHHQAYTDQLNIALAQYPELTGTVGELLTDLSKVPGDIRTAVRNNGGGYENHSLFWLFMKPHGGGEPVGKISTAITQRFGSFHQLQELMNVSAKSRFGSGWCWLVLNKAGDLEVMSTANQDSPLSEGCIPLLGVDVWEHAYYLKYQNRRVEYLDAWWHTVNWPYVNERYCGL